MIQDSFLWSSCILLVHCLPDAANIVRYIFLTHYRDLLPYQQLMPDI